MQLIELTGESLSGFPLYLRKIYFNRLVFLKEEQKLMKYSADVQTEKMCSASPSRRLISKTVNKQIFNSIEHEK